MSEKEEQVKNLFRYSVDFVELKGKKVVFKGMGRVQMELDPV